MSAEEKRELDAWIAEHVMNHKPHIYWSLLDERSGFTMLDFPSLEAGEQFLKRFKIQNKKGQFEPTRHLEKRKTD